MTRILLAAGVAALAITTPAASQPGDRGGGKDRGSQAQKSERGGGNARAQRGGNKEQRAERRNRGKEQRAERRNRGGNEQRAERRNRGGNEQRAERRERGGDERRAERRNRSGDEQRAQRGNRNIEDGARRTDRRGNERRAERLERNRDMDRGRDVNRQARAVDQRMNARDRQLARVADRDDRRFARVARERDPELQRLRQSNVVRVSEWNDLARRNVWVEGCPPGLAKKTVACVPPGQVRNVVGQRLVSLRDRVQLQEIPDRLRYVYPDTDNHYYRYGNGYAYRINRSNDIVSALLPLFGLGLTTGQVFPSAYSNSYLPTSLQSFYPDTQYSSYRYANGYVYEVNPMTGMIEAVDPLLGYGYGYGQMMPATYSAYNVPYQYRSMYYDTPDHYYRYAPGAIYQVDPSTSLITAVSALLTGGMNVGQQLPTGYGVYNVPYQYRTTYYDTPDNWYRYANGNVYRVDPTTQLVTAVVASLLT